MRRAKVPKTFRPPAVKPSCAICLDKLGKAKRLLAAGADVLQTKHALAIVNAVPPFGELVKVTMDDRRVWACPRCLGIDVDPKPGYEPENKPLIEVQRTRRDRRRAHLTSVRKPR